MRRIGVMVDLVGRFGRAALEGVTAYALAHGGFRLITPAPYGFFKLDAWDNWQIDGMVIQAYSSRIAAQFRERGLPTVNVSTILADSGLPTVTIDNVAVGRMAAEYLLERGFHNFAYMGSGADFARVRGNAFEHRLRESGRACHRPPVKVTDSPHDSEERKRLVQTLRSLPLPIGIFAANDPSAMCVLEACAEANIAVPEQAAVLGCDNDELLFRRTHPPLSSIVVPAEKIGYHAAQTLMDLMDGKAVAPLQTFEPLSVLTRKSTDILAINDPDVAEALRFIRTHAHKPILVDDVIAHVPVSRRVLEQRFHGIVGRSLLAEIRRVQLDLSQKLLLETDLAMPQIAKRCGFASASYFGISFRKNLGMTPSAFRRGLKCTARVE